jgi:hypothetical protein
VGGLPKPKFNLRSSLAQKSKGVVKSHSAYYREGCLPSPLHVVKVVTKGSPPVGLASVGASP